MIRSQLAREALTEGPKTAGDIREWLSSRGCPSTPAQIQSVLGNFKQSGYAVWDNHVWSLTEKPTGRVVASKRTKSPNDKSFKVNLQGGGLLKIHSVDVDAFSLTPVDLKLIEDIQTAIQWHSQERSG